MKNVLITDKIGFSEPFVHYILDGVLKQSKPGLSLDPFSGAGSALFAASAKGWKTRGIEVLPVGVYATHARFLAEKIGVQKIRLLITEMLALNFADYYDVNYKFKHIPITNSGRRSTACRLHLVLSKAYIR